MENYPARWDDEQRRVVDLDIFGQKVLDDLWSAICTEYPPEAPEIDTLTIERQAHDSFAEEHSRFHVGRLAEALRLSKYVQGTDMRPAVITGESGCGKTAFLASWSHKYASDHPDELVLTYFIGATPDSTQYLRLLFSICGELKHQFNFTQTLQQDSRLLPEALAVMLSATTEVKTRVILVVDALDQLATSDADHGLSWLLDNIPAKVRLVVSSLEGDCLEVLQRRKAEEITLPPLSENEQRQIVDIFIHEWKGSAIGLDGEQMSSLLTHPMVTNPLYLRIALEEMRLFGKYEELTIRIKNLAEDIPGLFDQVLTRLEEDRGRWLVSEVFSLLRCSRYGLSENEVLELLRRNGEEQFPRVLWARIIRSARPYLVQHGQLITFFHRQLADAVNSKYLQHDTKHAKLAAYFGDAPMDRKLEEFPFQLAKAQEWQPLAEALVDLDFFSYACQHDHNLEWMSYWRLLEGRYEADPCYRAAIDARIVREGETENIAYLCYTIGAFLCVIEQPKNALFFSQRAVAITTNVLGPNHPDVAASIVSLADAYRELGNYDESLGLFWQALPILAETLGTGHPRVASCLNNLAMLYRYRGEYSNSLPLYLQASAIFEMYDPKSLDMAMVLNNLGVIYDLGGKYSEALDVYERVLGIFKDLEGQDHPDVAMCLSNISELYRHQQKYKDALPICKQALAIRESIFGPNSTNVGSSLNNLGLLYRGLEMYEDALLLYRRSLAISEEAYGHDHPAVAMSLNNIASIYYAQEKYREAFDLFEDVLEMRLRVLPQNHPDLAKSYNNLAAMYSQQGRRKEAVSLYERAVTIAENTFGPNHPETQLYRSNLKSCQSVMH